MTKQQQPDDVVKSSKVILKWVFGVLGIAGIGTALTSANVVISRWNSIETIQANYDESQKDRKAIHDQIAGHEAEQRAEQARLSEQLKNIGEKLAMQQQQTEKASTDQQRRMDRIERKIDQITIGVRSGGAPYDEENSL